MKQIWQQSDPFEDKRCDGNNNCLICSTNGKGPCHAVGVTYELVCKNCGHKYIGETSPSDYTHGKEHVRALKEKRSVCCEAFL